MKKQELFHLLQLGHEIRATIEDTDGLSDAEFCRYDSTPDFPPELNSSKNKYRFAVLSLFTDIAEVTSTPEFTDSESRKTDDPPTP